jgi:hypothetical protein
MIKLQYLVRAPSTLHPGVFQQQILEDLTPRLLAHQPARMKITLTAEEPPRLSVIPFSKARIALISVWRETPFSSEIRRTYPSLSAGYVVEESAPVAYERDWPDGEVTPGVGLLTLLRRKKGLSDPEFFRRWHGGHSALSLEVHPLWSYIRNVVRSEAIEASPALCGIVEEHFRRRDDLLDPRIFFGGIGRMVPNMLRVGFDIWGFLDLASLETFLVTELWVRSG